MINSPEPQPLRFVVEPVELLKRAQSAIDDSRRITDHIAATVKPDDACFENVLLPLLHAENIYADISVLVRFPRDVSTKEKLREASQQAVKLTNDYSIEYCMREDIFRLVKAVIDKNEPLDVERRRCLEKSYRGYLQNGLGIPDVEDRKNFKEIAHRILDVCAECTKNFISVPSDIWLTPEELKGLPTANFEALRKGTGEHEGLVRIELKKSGVDLAMKYVLNPEIRKKIFLAFENKLTCNAPLVRELYILRDKAAKLLGFENNAQLKIEDTLAGSVDFVADFLGDLRQRLTPVARASIQSKLKLKSGHLKSLNMEHLDDGKLYLWDRDFYTRLMAEQRFSINEARISEYFPLDSTLSQMLQTFEKLFDLRFVEITHKLSTEIRLGYSEQLHPSVKAFQVWNNKDEDDSFIGHLYLDLYSRDFKRSQNTHLRFKAVRNIEYIFDYKES
jgi:metallopeptidase MepB